MNIHHVKSLAPSHWDLLLLADPSEAVIADYIDEATAFEYCVDGEVVGVIALVPSSSQLVEIKSLAVREDFENQGIAQKLITYAIDFAIEANYEKIEVGTGTTSFPQLYLYQKMGFRVERVLKDYFSLLYLETIYENELELRDMIMLQMTLPTAVRVMS